jgi:protein-tyrosine phosphatase
VYVHCKAGVSRAGLVTVAYLMWRDGLCRDEALQVVRSRRPQVQPTPEFMMLLLEWEQSLTGPGGRKGGAPQGNPR